MKKFYSLIAFGLFAGLSATAAVPVIQNQASRNSSEVKSVELKQPSFQKVAKSQEAGDRQKISSVDDLVGAYSQKSVWALAGDAAEFSPFITKGESANQVYITGLPYTDVEFEAIVDFENSTLRINQQEAYFNTQYNETVYLCFPDFANQVINESVVATIEEDGRIVFPEGSGVALKLLSYEPNNGYFFGVMNLELTPIRAFRFDASEWENAGEAEFADGWVTAAFSEDPYNIPTTPIQVLKSKTVAGDFLLVNPYKDGSAWYPDMLTEMGGYATDGYIRINIANPDCCYVYPLVGSGAYMENAPGVPEQMYNFNLEGYRIAVKDYTAEEVIDELQMNWNDVSYYDESDQTVHFYNLYFGIGENNMMGFYWWTSADDETIEGETIVKFNFDPYASVGEIAVDENAPVKYFNLQGMEVAQPAKGQLVIKKQGSKSVKMIAE